MRMEYDAEHDTWFESIKKITPKKDISTKKEVARNIINKLFSDDELLYEFNLQMRRRKLDKIKQSKKK